MGKRVGVQLFGLQNRKVIIDSAATEGAVVGRDLFWPDGTLITEQEVRNPAGSGSSTPSTPAQNLWATLIGIPAFIKSLAALATSGFVVRLSDGTATTREIQGTAGRIVTLDGDGEAGNTVINLGSFPTVQNGVYNGEVGTIPELHQMIVMDEFIFDDGILNIDGELVVL